MHPGTTATSLMVLLVANGTSRLDCVCKHVKNKYDDTGLDGFSYGEREMLWSYCINFGFYLLTEECEALEQPSIVSAAMARLVPTVRARLPAPSAGGGGIDGQTGEEGEESGEEGCGVALAGVRGLSSVIGWSSWEMLHLLVVDANHSCSLQGFSDMEWNQETLTMDSLRRPILSQLLQSFQCITKAIGIRNRCSKREKYGQAFTPNFINGNSADLSAFQQNFTIFWRDSARLLSLGVSHLSKLFIPLAFEHMGIQPNHHGLHGWIENARRVRDMLQSKLMALVHDVQYIAEQTVFYKLEKRKNNSRVIDLRRPLLNDGLLPYHQRFLSFHDHYSAVCEETMPNASKIFSLADALYSFHRLNWIRDMSNIPRQNGLDEDWQLEDRSNATISVDTDCVQLLASALGQPTCPLEDEPLETIERRLECRRQLWEDMVQRSPRVPVTSYLAYTQRANVNLCLLAWMAVNSLSICQEVPFSILQSVHDARCYSSRPGDRSCLQSNSTDAICSVSRAIFLLKCRDFSSDQVPETCGVNLYTNGSYSASSKVQWQSSVRGYVKPTEKTLNYRDTLNSATLKYKDFKVDSLKPLEISFIAINIVFRFSTLIVYMYLPHLRNLPGKILLSFQLTGMIQVLCSEVVYRMAGVPDLPTAVLIDSCLTLLSCIFLNAFCYLMYACVRHLRLPNDLLPVEASKVFHRQLFYALIPWSAVCAACFALEKSSNSYLLHSRVLFLTGISVSVAFNLMCLGLVAYMYNRTQNSMQQLNIYSVGKFASKKQLVFMSVKTVVLSGIGMIIRIGFHQSQDIAQFVYYVHVTTMLQGPVLFVLFVCNGTTIAALRNRVLAWWNPYIIGPGQELCSAAERNLERRRNEQAAAAESPL